MSYNVEQFSFNVPEYGAELTNQAHQTLYWLNRNGYLDKEDTEHLLQHMVVVPIKNTPRFGTRLLSRFFRKDATDNSYVFPITLLDVKETYASSDQDKPTLRVVK
jgi:hypothetical protein